MYYLGHTMQKLVFGYMWTARLKKITSTNWPKVFLFLDVFTNLRFHWFPKIVLQ